MVGAVTSEGGGGGGGGGGVATYVLKAKSPPDVGAPQLAPSSNDWSAWPPAYRAKGPLNHAYVGFVAVPFASRTIAYCWPAVTETVGPIGTDTQPPAAGMLA